MATAVNELPEGFTLDAAPAPVDLAALEDKHGLPKGLLSAIKKAEGSGAQSVSPKQARGVFQFIPATAKAYGLDDPTDEAASADAAARYMADSIKKYGTSDPRVLAAEYNGGPTQAKAVLAGKAPPALETQKYIQKVSASMPSSNAGSDLPAGFTLDQLPAGFKLDATAKPVAKKETSPTSFGNLVGAAVEPMLSIASGAIAQPIAGISGLVDLAAGGGAEGAARMVEKVQHALTYQPRSTGGKNAMQVIGYLPEKLDQVADLAGEKAANLTGSPAVGAAIKTAIEGGPQILLAKGIGEAVPAPTPRVVSPSAALLASKDISLPPGELLGGGWARAEAALARRPIVGIPIRAAQERSIVDFNRAFVNDALADIGQRLPEGLQGHTAIAYSKGKLSDAYDNLLVQMRGELDAGSGPSAMPTVPGQPIPAQTPSLRMELDSLKSIAQNSKMPAAKASELADIINEQIIDRFDPGGTVSGETLKAIQSTVKQISRQKMRSEDYYTRNQGLALKEANAAIDRMVREVNPQQADALKAIDAGYAKFKIAQKAVAGSTNADGLVTPTGFMRAVRAKDPSKDKSAYTAGTALQQELAKAASAHVPDVLPEKVNLSRLATHAIAGKLKGTGLIGAPGGAAIAALISPAYSATGSSLLRQAMMGNRMAAGRLAAQAGVFGYGSLDEEK